MPEEENPCKGKIKHLENQIGLLHPAFGYDHRVFKALRRITKSLADVLECMYEELPP